MDHVARFFSFARRFDVQERIRSIRARRLEVRTTFLKVTKISLFFGLSIIFGMHAMDAAETQALKDWQTHFPPSQKIVEFSLETFGYRKVGDDAKANKAQRSLPMEADPENSIWITRQGDWIVKLGTDSGPTLFRAETARAAPEKQDWELLGSSWNGLAAASIRAEQAWNLAKSKSKAKKMPKWTDSRAIRY